MARLSTSVADPSVVGKTGISKGWVERRRGDYGPQADVCCARAFYPFSPSLKRICVYFSVLVGKIIRVEMENPFVLTRE